MLLEVAYVRSTPMYSVSMRLHMSTLCVFYVLLPLLEVPVFLSVAAQLPKRTIHS